MHNICTLFCITIMGAPVTGLPWWYLDCLGTFKLFKAYFLRVCITGTTTLLLYWRPTTNDEISHQSMYDLTQLTWNHSVLFWYVHFLATDTYHIVENSYSIRVLLFTCKVSISCLCWIYRWKINCFAWQRLLVRVMTLSHYSKKSYFH